MSYFMGYFFLGFAFFKLLDITAFADAFSSYDILAKRSRSYALAYSWGELTLGVLFVTRAYPQLLTTTALVPRWRSSLAQAEVSCRNGSVPKH